MLLLFQLNAVAAADSVSPAAVSATALSPYVTSPTAYTLANPYATALGQSALGNSALTTAALAAYQAASQDRV